VTPTIPRGEKYYSCSAYNLGCKLRVRKPTWGVLGEGGVSILSSKGGESIRDVPFNVTF